MFFHVLRNDKVLSILFYNSVQYLNFVFPCKVKGEIKIGYWYRKFCRTSAISRYDTVRVKIDLLFNVLV